MSLVYVYFFKLSKRQVHKGTCLTDTMLLYSQDIELTSRHENLNLKKS